MNKTTTPFLFRWYGLLLVAIIIVGTYVAYPLVLSCILSAPQDRGLFGDSFGALSSAFSALAFLAVLYTLRLQHKDSQENATQLKNQTTERLFFQMLRSYETIVDNTRISAYGDTEFIGRSAFAHLSYWLKHDAGDNPQSTGVSRKAYVTQTYEKFYEGSTNELGHVFRLLYHIVLFVDHSDLSTDGKKTYTRILRAHLSNAELILLLYNGLSAHGRKKFFPLIERYALLKNIDETKLLSPSDLDYYPQNKSARNLEAEHAEMAENFDPAS